MTTKIPTVAEVTHRLDVKRAERESTLPARSEVLMRRCAEELGKDENFPLIIDVAPIDHDVMAYVRKKLEEAGWVATWSNSRGTIRSLLTIDFPGAAVARAAGIQP